MIQIFTEKIKSQSGYDKIRSTGIPKQDSNIFVKVYVFHKHNVYKHNEAQISNKLSIFQAYF